MMILRKLSAFFHSISDHVVSTSLLIVRFALRSFCNRVGAAKTVSCNRGIEVFAVIFENNPKEQYTRVLKIIFAMIDFIVIQKEN